MKFKLNEPFETDQPTVDVDPLPRGRYRFQLIVIDKNRRRSAPVEFVVTVL